LSSKLSPQQTKAMKKHSVHHSAKHMSKMSAAMKQGSSFSKAHKLAMKEVGK